MSQTVIKGYGIVTDFGNGRHYSYTESCSTIEVLGDGTSKRFEPDLKEWTLQVSGFEPSSVPAAGSVITAAANGFGGTGIVTSCVHAADVGGLATYDLTVKGPAGSASAAREGQGFEDDDDYGEGGGD